MQQHTPELYRALQTPVSIDLGSTVGAIADIRTAVQTTIPTTVAAAASDIGQIKQQTAALSGIPLSLATLTQGIGAPKIDLLTDVQAMITLAANGIVDSVHAVRPHIALEQRGAPLVRLLVQAQAVAIDATPSEPYSETDKKYNKNWSKNDVALDQLLSAALKHADVLGTGPIKDRLVHAFDKFTADDLLSRSKRFDEMHRLIEDIAAYLDDAGAAAGRN